ncbi:MAG TPA: type II secretion system F family protein [Kineosporiaceae bacterium]
MTPAAFTGALLGLIAGLGGWLVAVRLPWRRSPTLDDRLGPYLRQRRTTRPEPPAASPGGGPLRTLERLLAPVMADAVRWVERISGGPGTVRRRLDQLGHGGDLEQFRAEQVVWGVLGAGAGGGLGVLAGLGGGGVSLVPVLALVVVGGLLGVLGRDRWLTAEVRRREQRMLAEFPTVAELLALSVGAGEGAVGGLERVARTCQGELSTELRRTLADARAGATLVQALEGLARRTSLPSLARFVDGVAVAVERGTPLAEVLRAQAQDVRELTRRRLIEAGGRKEILMMVPVVFLVLPITVLFAVFPGLAVLDLSP